MLILIILGVLFAVSIALIVINAIVWWEDCIFYIFFITAFISGIALLICGIIVAAVQILKENDYQKMLYKAQILEYRLEHKEENIIGNEMLYSEITDFNNDLRTCKRYSNSLWVGLFYNDKIATIEYIEIDD